MIERFVAIGTAGELAGILTQHDADQAQAADVAVVFLNAGFLHRVGPNRMYVTLARRLASHGVLALRYDAAGIGESASRNTDATRHRRDVADAIDVLDHLEQQFGIRRVILCGLCSGAELAHDVAVVDSRVDAVIALEGYSYPTLGHYARLIRAGLRRVSTWRNVLTGRHPLTRWLRPSSRTRAAGPSFGFGRAGRKRPPQAVIAAGLATLVQRGVGLLLFFAGSDEYSYAAQFRRAFPRVPFGDQLTVYFEPHADHTFSDVPTLDRIAERIEAWVVARYVRRSASPTNRSSATDGSNATRNGLGVSQRSSTT
ncbi:MAG: alpha/beta hydrolase [Gemmatimonadaceae bacterium]|nr:alpha/beta hydrolase [Gemmatimonadaceae bacterium]